MSQIIATVLVVLLMLNVRQVEWLRELGGPLTPSTMTVGFILLIAYMAGRAVFRVKLPRITGYMVVGLVAGPYFLNLISYEMAHQLQLINGLALSFIALTAGGALRLRELRPVWRSLCAVTLAHIVILWIVFVGFVCLARTWFPFLEGMPWSVVVLTGVVLGTIASASSPAVAIAIINESRSHGPVSESVLGITVLKDIMVIALFSLVLTVGEGITSPEMLLDLVFVSRAVFGLLASVGVGVLLGILIILYLKYIKVENTLFIVGICFISAEAGLLFHLEPALIALSAGFFMENVYPERGDRLIRAIEQGSLPVYTLFFCLAGAFLNIDALKEMWFLAVVLVLLRMIGLFSATYIGARLGGAVPAMQRYGYLGFVAQAGVSLGLAAILLRVFPEWGAPLQTLIIAMVAINQLIGPIGFRFALIRSREAHA